MKTDTLLHLTYEDNDCLTNSISCWKILMYGSFSNQEHNLFPSLCPLSFLHHSSGLVHCWIFFFIFGAKLRDIIKSVMEVIWAKLSLSLPHDEQLFNVEIPMEAIKAILLINRHLDAFHFSNTFKRIKSKEDRNFVIQLSS